MYGMKTDLARLKNNALERRLQQEERSEADRRAEAQPALTVAAPADSEVEAAL